MDLHEYVCWRFCLAFLQRIKLPQKKSNPFFSSKQMDRNYLDFRTITYGVDNGITCFGKILIHPAQHYRKPFAFV